MKDSYLIGIEQADESIIYVSGINHKEVETTLEYTNAWNLGTEEDATMMLDFIKKNYTEYQEFKVIEIKVQTRIITHEVTIDVDDVEVDNSKVKEEPKKVEKKNEEKIKQVVPEVETSVEIEE